MATATDLERAVLSVVGEGQMAQPMFMPDEDVSPPYVLLQPETTRVFQATDRCWTWRTSYVVALCTARVDMGLVGDMLAALDAAGIGFEDEIEHFWDADERVEVAVIRTELVDKDID
jgi:hypothetical protein